MFEQFVFKCLWMNYSVVFKQEKMLNVKAKHIWFSSPQLKAEIT